MSMRNCWWFTLLFVSKCAGYLRLPHVINPRYSGPKLFSTATPIQGKSEVPSRYDTCFLVASGVIGANSKEIHLPNNYLQQFPLAVVGHFAPVNEQERFRPTETMWLQCEWWDEEARVNAQKLVKGAEINVVGVLVENKWKDKASGEERKQHRFRISKLLTKEELESLIVILGKDKKVDVANNDVNAIPPVWSTPANPTPPPITTPTVAAVVPKTATVSAPSPPTLPTSTIKPKPRAKVIPNTNNTIASTTTVTTTAAPHNSNNTITKTVPTEDKHKQEQEGSMGIVSENATKNIAVVASKPSPPSSNKRPLAKTPRTYKPPNTIPAINNNNNNSVKNSSSNSNSSFGKKSSLSSAPQPMRPPSPSVIPVVTMKGAAKEVEGDEAELTWDSIEANLR